jgi:tetratricopeptide (TPR) repeat protein
MTMLRKFLTGSVLLAVATSVSLAQVRQLQLTSPMDANPQVGAGGTNRPVPGFVPVNGNDIMTGNVSGLAYFHGQSGTLNPYQFGGQGLTPAIININGTPTVIQRSGLGSGSLANFARQSAGAPLNGGTYTGMTVPYYLPSATVSTGQGALYAAPMGSGFDSAIVPRYSYSPAMSAAQVRDIRGTVGGEAIIRSMTPPAPQPGTPGALLSSPLFVLRSTEIPNEMSGLSAVVPATKPAQVLPRTQAGGENKAGAGEQSMPEEDKALENENPNMVQGAVGGGLSQRVRGVSEELKTARVSENYLKLAEELRVAEGPRLASTTQPKEKMPGGVGTSAMAQEMDIDPFTGKPRQFSMLAPTTAPGLNKGATGTQPATQGSRTLATRAAGVSAQGLTELSDAELRAGSKVKPVRLTPPLQAGTTVSAYDLLMSRAEKELQDGKFLNAAETYQEALGRKPEDPLALVGRGNAELAAGIYAGAEFDLKFVFARNPTMVGVMYEPSSFVPANRQAFLLADLQKLMAKKDAANMASFLYCYICYETGRKAQLDTELQNWGAREGHDEWQVVAQRAWGTAK